MRRQFISRISDSADCKEIKSYKDCVNKKKCRWKEKSCVRKSPRCLQRKYYETCVSDKLCMWDKQKCVYRDTDYKNGLRKDKVYAESAGTTARLGKRGKPDITGTISRHVMADKPKTKSKIKTKVKSKIIDVENKTSTSMDEITIDDYLLKNMMTSRKTIEALAKILHRMIDIYIYDRRLISSNLIKKINKSRTQYEHEKKIDLTDKIHNIRKRKMNSKRLVEGNDLSDDYNSEKTVPLDRWRPQVLDLDDTFNSNKTDIM